MTSLIIIIISPATTCSVSSGCGLLLRWLRLLRCCDVRVGTATTYTALLLLSGLLHDRNNSRRQETLGVIV